MRLEKNERWVVTWNLQKTSMREENRRRLRDVCDRIEREGLEAVLVTELTATGDGVVWLGEDENRIAVVHSEKAGVILR